MKKNYDHSIGVTVDIIGGKWKPLILCQLGNGVMRTGELKKQIPNISQKMLTQHLRELEEDGIITRNIYSQIPPKVEYELTDAGRSLQEVLIAMSQWGVTRIKEINETGKNITLEDECFSGFLKY
ncbi:transcriptional regulator [Companilactobacillus sp. RD055328]|uniref:winged helix-turn-helix transcriptional regulator n=1 Tax=Companilactobacillus sp. RD055328 TaxID=2916634 RepID=UPI001FC81FA1|nr:helix-turn-helix domain-containing protein [Companilactobacillus sp. RD055328]GKQ42966.1 transcriptional regulator [Companilactobacillus sp. RD055328]